MDRSPQCGSHECLFTEEEVKQMDRALEDTKGAYLVGICLNPCWKILMLHEDKLEKFMSKQTRY